MEEIIANRIKLLAKANQLPQLQAIEMESCRKDILYFFRNYLVTDKNKTIFADSNPDIIPFIPFPFQEEYITEIWKSITEWNKPIEDRDINELTNIFIEKSRQMGISRLTAAIFLYWFLFHQHKYTIISRTSDEVDKSGDMDSMFEKIRFMIRNLPIWMLPKGFNKEPWKDKTNAYMNISDPNSQASITGKTANRDAGRWWTRNAIFMDEMPTMAYAHEINMAAWSNTPCRIFNWTPNGTGNEFYRMRKYTMKWRDEDGVEHEPTVKWLRYHRSDHPLYTAKRHKRKIKGMSREEIARELEIDYNVALEWRVYTEFPINPTDVKYTIWDPLYMFIDHSHWWKDPHALIIAQRDWEYLNIIDAIEINCSVTDMAEFCIWQPKFWLNVEQNKFMERYKTYNRQRATFIWDPYDTHSTLNQSTIYEEYRKVGIYLNTPQNRNKKEQIMMTRSNIHTTRYNENCLKFADAMMNARYPERRETSMSTTPADNPIHDRTSHYRSAFEYWRVFLLENPVTKKKRIAEDKRPMRNKLTWRLIYHNNNQRC